jgi:predicted nucleic acid-binding protein
MQTVVSNSSPIIILAKTGNLKLFKNIFSKVIIPQSVYNEIIKKKDTASELIKKSEFIIVEKIEDSETLQNLYLILDEGEAEAIALANKHDLVLVIDEKKGRKIAKNFRLQIIGFLGILLLNYRNKFISRAEIIKILKQSHDFGYRLSDSLKKEFLKNIDKLY